MGFKVALRKIFIRNNQALILERSLKMVNISIIASKKVVLMVQNYLQWVKK
jgi:hypothetical protein